MTQLSNCFIHRLFTKHYSNPFYEDHIYNASFVVMHPLCFIITLIYIHTPSFRCTMSTVIKYYRCDNSYKLEVDWWGKYQLLNMIVIYSMWLQLFIYTG